MSYKVDNSRLCAVATCTTKAILRYVHDLASKEEKIARFAGKIMHEALARFYRGMDVALVVVEFEKEYRATADELVPPDDRLAYTNVVDILQEYCETHPPDRLPFTIETEGIEKCVSAYLDDERTIELYCKLDMPVREKATGALHVCDHKTTGKVSPWWAKKFRLGSQLTGYIWSLAEEYGEVVPGAYINAIEMGKLPDSSRKCKKHGVPFYECRRQHTKFELFVTSRTPEDLENWRKDAVVLGKRLMVLEQAYGASVELVRFAPQEGKFNDGCTFCEFREFCAAQRLPEFAESMLVKDPWRPWLE